MANPTRSRSRAAKIAVTGTLSALLAAGFATASAQSARDYISIVGSSTVFPFATVVAERFGRNTKFKAPTIESTGTGGGFKLFCGGVGVQYPDISDASRAIKQSEINNCLKNGVTDIVQVKIGYDGIVIANSRDADVFDLDLDEIYQALAKTVPDPKNPMKLVPNPYKKWSEIDPRLPETDIEVLGPPPTSGTRDAFLELAMSGGCEDFAAIKALPEEEVTPACHTIREDGAYIEAGENDNLIVQKLEANHAALGIFGYSFLDQNADMIQGAHINGVEPTFDNISDRKYPLSRPLFFYVKKAHINVIPGIKEYLAEFTSDKAWGEYGYLADKGLIPMPAKERAEVAASVAKLETLKLMAK